MEIQKQIEDINGQAMNNADTKMDAVYNKQKQAMEEIMAFIALLYFHYEINGSLKLNRAQKQAIFKQLNTKLIKIYNELGDTEKETITSILIANYRFLYDETFDVYNINHVSKPVLTEQDIMAAVMLPIAGEPFTDRILTNKNKMIKLLNKSLTNVLNGNTTSDAAKKQIESVFNLTAYDSKRLMTSEDTRVRAQASIDVSNDLGLKKHKWSATFEHTCERCRKLHGKTFDINDVLAPTIPLHANCQCIWINLENSDTIKLPDTVIGRSIGAKAKNYDIKLPNGEYVNLVEGSKITNSTVIAGKGKNRQIDELDVLIADYGGNPAEWQKVKGFGYVNVDGEELKAELHWYQEPSIGKVKMKIKPQRDGELFIYED